MYSQNNEEEIIAELLKQLKPRHKFLVDIGAGDGYTLSNTRALLDSGWHGLLIDGNGRGNKDVVEAWITADNILDLLACCPLDFDLLSIDIDGNDYWILDRILTNYRPRIVVCEINGCLDGLKVMPYNKDHRWNGDDYYGFSYEAGCFLATKHGYHVCGQTDALNLYLATEQVDLNLPPFRRTQYHRPSNRTDWTFPQ